MDDFIFSLIAFIVIYLMYVFFVILRKNKLEKFKQNSYVRFLVSKYKVDLDKVNFKIIAHAIALTNSFIISVILFIITNVDNWIIKISLAFVMSVILQLVMYTILGKLFEKKGRK